MGFVDSLEIDHNALDIEWLEQPKKFFRVSKKLADAREEMHDASLQLDVIVAEVGQETREALEKPTVAAVADAVIQDKRVIEAKQMLKNYRNEVDVCQAEVSAMDMRKKALENAVRLLGLEYFASPQTPRDIDAEYLERAKKKEIRGKGKKKKKKKGD